MEADLLCRIGHLPARLLGNEINLLANVYHLLGPTLGYS
jgi:hypothetical protein